VIDQLISFGNNRWDQAGGRLLSIRGHGSGRRRRVWFLTTNDDFLGSPGRRTRLPASGRRQLQLQERRWVGLNGSWYTGGETHRRRREGRPQKNSRVGLTCRCPRRPHSMKLVAQTGAYTSVGADFDEYTVAYQYRW
jgi:hypothetical protein